MKEITLTYKNNNTLIESLNFVINRYIFEDLCEDGRDMSYLFLSFIEKELKEITNNEETRIKMENHNQTIIVPKNLLSAEDLRWEKK